MAQVVAVSNLKHWQCISVPLMAGRPRTINPTGETRSLRVNVPATVAQRIEREAKKRGVSVATVVRERLAQVA